MMPTERDFIFLRIVEQSITNDGIARSLKEIRAQTGMNSDNTVRKGLIRLEKAGYIQRRALTARAIKLLKRAPETANRA
jgi:SOS-response transcriptional repressor LexA